jgi:hypothetical protein
MNQEKLIQANPPLLNNLFYVLPTEQPATKTIEKTTIQDFLYLSRLFLGLDKRP